MTTELLRDWLKFASDCVPSDPAAYDWLDSLRTRTETILTSPGKGWSYIAGWHCEGCGVMYTEGAAHFSGCALSPGQRVEVREHA